MNLQKRMRLFKFELVVGSVGVNKKCPTYDSIFFFATEICLFNGDITP